jgi:hypothetical protein
MIANLVPVLLLYLTEVLTAELTANQHAGNTGNTDNTVGLPV